MAAYERRAAPVQGDRPRGDRYGRAMSLGRWESDRSIEERYGRGYEGDPLAISDFFRYGRERYSRPTAYDKVEPYRRTAHHRSQSHARLDSQRFSDDRYQGRFDDGYERYPREFVEDRYARDHPEDRFTGRQYSRQYFDDFYPADRFIYERPPFDRFAAYDRLVFERPAGDRYGERFYERYGPEDRFYGRGERFDAERHQEQQQRYGKENRAERFDNDRNAENQQQQRYGGKDSSNQRYQDRYERQADRYERQDRYNRQLRRQDQRQDRTSGEDRREKRNGRYRVERQNSSPDREQREVLKYSEERDGERRLSGGEREEFKYAGDRERPTVDCTERFRKA